MSSYKPYHRVEVKVVTTAIYICHVSCNETKPNKTHSKWGAKPSDAVTARTTVKQTRRVLGHVSSREVYKKIHGVYP
jgi:hypothetical protein